MSTAEKDIRVETLTSSDELQEWDALVLRSPQGTVFHHSWWLESAGLEFRLIAARSPNGRLLGGIPLPFSNRWGMRLVRNPALTPYLGPVIDDSDDPSSYAIVSQIRKVGVALGEAIRRIDHFGQHLGPKAPDLQGFLWSGFSAQLRYSFVIGAESCPDDVLHRMHPKHRAELLKASRNGVHVTESDDIATFLELNQKTFLRQGLRPHYDESQVSRLWIASRERGHASLLLATNAIGKVTDGALLFTDARCTYLVMVGGDPEFRGSGGGNAVIWKGIQDSLTSGRAFDFEGSAIPNVEFFYRRWGGIPQPTVYLQKTFTHRARLAVLMRECLMRA